MGHRTGRLEWRQPLERSKQLQEIEQRQSEQHGRLLHALGGPVCGSGRSQQFDLESTASHAVEQYELLHLRRSGKTKSRSGSQLCLAESASPREDDYYRPPRKSTRIVFHHNLALAIYVQLQCLG